MKNPERPTASVHVPRTGGSSLRKFWIDLYGPEKVLLYSRETERFHRAEDDGMLSRANPVLYFLRDIMVACNLNRFYRLIRDLDYQRRRVKEYSGGDYSEFRVIHGHFPPVLITDLVKGDVSFVTVIRDPLERTLSAYFFYANWRQLSLKMCLLGMKITCLLENLHF